MSLRTKGQPIQIYGTITQFFFYFSQPFFVSITSGLAFLDQPVYCGGALIDKNWVLTSASCYLSEIRVHLGGPTNATKQMYFLFRISIKFNSMLSISSSRGIRHPDYTPHGNRNDLALIKNSFNLKFKCLLACINVGFARPELGNCS